MSPLLLRSWGNRTERGTGGSELARCKSVASTHLLQPSQGFWHAQPRRAPTAGSGSNPPLLLNQTRIDHPTRLFHYRPLSAHIRNEMVCLRISIGLREKCKWMHMGGMTSRHNVQRQVGWGNVYDGDRGRFHGSLVMTSRRAVAEDATIRARCARRGSTTPGLGSEPRRTRAWSRLGFRSRPRAVRPGHSGRLDFGSHRAADPPAGPPARRGGLQRLPHADRGAAQDQRLILPPPASAAGARLCG